MESPWRYLAKMWWNYRYLCITHILVITIIRFFLTFENLRIAKYVDCACALIVFVVILRQTKDPRTTGIIIILNSFVGPMIVGAMFYPLIMGLRQLFGL